MKKIALLPALALLTGLSIDAAHENHVAAPEDKKVAMPEEEKVAAPEDEKTVKDDKEQAADKENEGKDNKDKDNKDKDNKDKDNKDKDNIDKNNKDKDNKDKEDMQEEASQTSLVNDLMVDLHAIEEAPSLDKPRLIEMIKEHLKTAADAIKAEGNKMVGDGLAALKAELLSIKAKIQEIEDAAKTKSMK